LLGLNGTDAASPSVAFIFFAKESARAREGSREGPLTDDRAPIVDPDAESWWALPDAFAGRLLEGDFWRVIEIPFRR